jgi:GT2 family glycosyltransferase
MHYSINFEILPLSCSQKNSSEGWSWVSNDPFIQLLSNSSVSLKGYYMLEVQISGLKQSINASFNAGVGEVFSEHGSFTLPITRIAPGSKTVKRICYFDNAVDSFRFFPSEEEGCCKSLSIKLIKLPRFRAKKLMLKKLVHKSFDTSTIYEAYNRLFSKINVGGYGGWIKKHETESVPEIAQKIDNLAVTPLISIVCPVYNTKLEWLVACVESVINQYYSHWELILIDDASFNKAHFDALKLYDGSDSRIKVIYLDENKHISAATNAGIEKANGEYVLFLDHDDELSKNALLEICSVIAANPSAKVIYSDEDLISECGERVTPHFKSDWNAELLRAHNYITHLCCYDMALVKSLGGMRLGYEGAQDYDLILRASTLVDPNDIHHISKILYHWRMVEGSTALSSSAKSYATEAGLKALRDYITSNGLAASAANSERDNFYTIKYSLPSVLPKVSIIIPTRDGMEVLRPCIESLLSVTDYNNYEVIILDNGSEEKETLRYLERLSKKDNFKIVRDIGEFNYSRINNIAVGHSTGELICLLNNDIKIIDKAWLTEMVSIAIREEVGCVGAKLLYPDGTLQHAGVILGLGGYAAHSHRGLSGNAPGYFCRAQIRQQLSAVTGACLLIKRDIYNEVGGLDESFQVAYNDVDFCLRVQALGYQNIYTPFARLIHHESKTRGEDNDPVKIKRFDREKVLLSTRWGDVIKNDPFYNVNLTRSREDFSI